MLLKEIDQLLEKTNEYNNDFYIEQIDRYFASSNFDSAQLHMQWIHAALKQAVNVASQIHCCVFHSGIHVDAKVVSFLQDATRFLEKYYQTYDEHFGFTCYTNRNMRREGETCYNDIIIRHFTPPRHIQQADNEMIILWHDFRHVMIILLEAKRILTAVTQPENFTAPSGEAA